MSENSATDVSRSAMPQVPLGPHLISRLICGGNPTNGISHMSPFIDREMAQYFSPERILGLLGDCEGEGINVWQTCPTQRFPNNLDILRKYRAMGGKMHYISIATQMEGRGQSGENDSIDQIAAAGATSIAHWGSFTDRAWRSGELDQVEEYLKKVRDAGLVVGLSTHRPEVVDYVESKGWDLDFYMTSIYDAERTAEEVEGLLGHVMTPGDGRDVYLEDDPPRMFRVIQKTTKTCLVFKIVAAGRHCKNQEMVAEAFKRAFSHIKAKDAVIVGMYPKFEDQVQLNAGYVRRFSELSL